MPAGQNTGSEHTLAQRQGLPRGPGRALRAVANLAVWLAWGWLYGPVFQYLSTLFTREEFRTNQILLLGVAGLIFAQARKSSFRFGPDAPPRFSIPKLALAIGASLAYLLSERFLDIRTLAAIFFGLATYGLIGLWLSPRRWRQGLPAMLLVVGLLPFGEHLETFIGYPLRLFTAGLAREGLNALGFHAVGADTILAFESGITQVDIPCSGVKSLWTGMLFLLAATWVENRRLGLRWLLLAFFTAILLVAANLARVTLLALAGPALGWSNVASFIHLPLGALGFIGVCAAVVYLLRRLPQLKPGDSPKPLPDPVAGSGSPSRPAWLSPALMFALAGMALAYSPRFDPNSAVKASPIAWKLPAELGLAPAPLSSRELDWVRQGGADTAARFNFTWEVPGGPPLNGALMLLTSRTWRGQHRPERCFEVFGLTVEDSETVLLLADFPTRRLGLVNGASTEKLTAVYWLQSVSQTTEDFGKRIWSDLGAPQERWVLVTVLFDQVRDPNSAELSVFFSALHASVAHSLEEGEGK